MKAGTLVSALLSSRTDKEHPMRIQLSDHFSYSRLIRFVLPSITMMIFTSIYGIVDGLCVSNLVGKTSFAAINLIWPYLMGLTVTGFMIGAGGTALVSRSLGEGKKERANQEFSLLVYITIGIGLAFTVLALITMRPVAVLTVRIMIDNHLCYLLIIRLKIIL